MASLQKYFDYDFGTCCGIPGVEMTGSEEDWVQLTEKTKKLETLLTPIMDEIGLGEWSVFRSTPFFVFRHFIKKNYTCH